RPEASLEETPLGGSPAILQRSPIPGRDGAHGRRKSAGRQAGRPSRSFQSNSTRRRRSPASTDERRPERAGGLSLWALPGGVILLTRAHSELGLTPFGVADGPSKASVNPLFDPIGVAGFAVAGIV